MTTSAKYRISESDYVDALRLFSKLSSKAVKTYSVIGLAFVAIAVFGSDAIQGGAIGGLIGAIIVVPFCRYAVSPILARRHYKKYKAIHEEFEVELVDDGLKMSSRNGNWLVRWDQTLKWREDEKFVLIYPMPRIYYVVPKHIASLGFNLDLLRERLTSCVGTAV